MSTPPRARRRDAVEKRRAIEIAATDLVLDLGYDAVTVDMICERAGVSQRTFFNHFRTKDAALLGPEPPSIDERAAREFVTSRGPLLSGIARVIRIDSAELAEDPVLMARRIRVVGSTPILMARQMERLSSIEAELQEIVRLRLRTQWPDEDESTRAREAELITHLLAGLMRHIATRWAREAQSGAVPTVDPQAIEDELTSVLSKLS